MDDFREKIVDSASNLITDEAVGRAVGKQTYSNIKTAKKVGETVVGGGMAVASATGLTVAATSGAGIASGLAAAGAVVGGGMAAGPAVLAGGPAALGAKVINETMFKDAEDISQNERTARGAARFATNTAAVAGVAGVGAVTVAGGASGAAIMGTLAAVGGVVGGGALAGIGLLAAAPVGLAVASGWGIYKLFGGGEEKE